MTKKSKAVSAVTPNVLMTKLPDAGTTLVTLAVVPAVAATASTLLLAVTRLFVTVIVVPAAAMFTRPVGLLIVWFPVVPGGVIVEARVTLPVVVKLTMPDT